MTLNEQLKGIYSPYLNELKVISEKSPDKFSYPLLMNVFPEYELVKKKILFVGKETKGWYDTMENPNVSIDLLLSYYKEFELGKDYYNSPFWRFVKTFNQSINGNQYPTGFLWTNFSKCDSNATTPDLEMQKSNDIGFDLLKNELKITNPEIVLFLTGWDYENQFQRVFDGIKYVTIEEDYIYQCKHDLLPEKTFMTMHPNALNFRKKFNSSLEKIKLLCEN